jgi:hypothetical protein
MKVVTLTFFMWFSFSNIGFMRYTIVGLYHLMHPLLYALVVIKKEGFFV